MTRKTDRLRRAIYALADAFADYLEAEGAPSTAPPPKVSDTTPAPNPEMCEAFARRELKQNGWVSPPRRRGAG